MTHPSKLTLVFAPDLLAFVAIRHGSPNLISRHCWPMQTREPVAPNIKKTTQ